LSIALSLASGSTPVIGIITAIWSGVISAFTGGSNFNIIGPTGALTSMLMAAVIATSDLHILPLIAIASSLVLFIITYFRLFVIVDFIPQSVIHGFTIGIALILSLSQLNSLFNITSLTASSNAAVNLYNSISFIISNISEINYASFLMFALSLFLLVT